MLGATIIEAVVHCVGAEAITAMSGSALVLV
jgi:hypothetical protein